MDRMDRVTGIESAELEKSKKRAIKNEYRNGKTHNKIDPAGR